MTPSPSLKRNTNDEPRPPIGRLLLVAGVVVLLIFLLVKGCSRDLPPAEPAAVPTHRNLMDGVKEEQLRYEVLVPAKK